MQILALGKGGPEIVNADLFVLTDNAPSLTPEVRGMTGVSIRAYPPASMALLGELQADRGMGWMPRDGMWLTAPDRDPGRAHQPRLVDRRRRTGKCLRW